MAATSIPALVIKHNNDVYLNEDLDVGVIMSIPTQGSGGVPDGDFWAVPNNDHGVIDGFHYVPTTPNSTDAPSAQSFHVFRLTNRFGNDVWYALGSTTDSAGSGSPLSYGYIEAAQDAECCIEDARTLPISGVPALAPCQELCHWDADENYFGIFGLPSLPAGWNYFAYGYFNDVEMAALSPAGYSTTGTLITAMNSTWEATVGGTFALTDTSPGVDLIIKLTQTDGPGTDNICINIIAINPSA